MGMRAKAVENLRAAESLIGLGLHDSAASRLYYSLYNAGVDSMRRMGRRPGDFTRGADEWRHATVVGNASLYRRQLRDVILFRTTYSLRLRADYDSVSVTGRELLLQIGEARSFVEEVCTDG